MSVSQVGHDSNDDRSTSPIAIGTPIPALSLWLCPLDAGASDLDRMAATLSVPERERAAHFGTPALRARYVAGRAMLRALLAAEVHRLPAEVPLRHGPRGRPELEPAVRTLDFNVSHTLDVALIGILRGGQRTARVGVDIEHLDRKIAADRLARRYLTARERSELEPLAADARRRRFIRLWTCKEALSKATGDGLRAPMGLLDVDLADRPRLVEGPPPYSPTDWQLLSVPLAGGYVATAAIWTPPDV